MIYVKVVEDNADVTRLYKEVEIEDLTEIGIGQCIYECKRLIDDLEDAHRAIMDKEDE